MGWKNITKKERDFIEHIISNCCEADYEDMPEYIPIFQSIQKKLGLIK